METAIPIMVFGVSFLLVLVWALASRKGKGCCGSKDADSEERKACSTEEKPGKDQA
ncbi:MAG: hypothetical protein HZA01_10280 [Nitrospinae bacterium]|nr:hypothetical protein [Nitrospinota bacterium]